MFQVKKPDDCVLSAHLVFFIFASMKSKHRWEEKRYE